MSKNINNQLTAYLEWCESIADMTEQTLRSKKYNLLSFINQIDISDMEDFTNEVFNDWKHKMMAGLVSSRKYKINTCNTRIKVVRAFVKWLKDCDICRVPAQIPYMTLVKDCEEKNYTFYSREQVAEVIEKADFMEKAMICLLFESGLRLTEFQNIRLEDIDFDNNSISILGKGRKWGRVFFTEECKHYLINYINENNLMYGYLWASARNGYAPYTRDALRVKLKVPFERVGIYGFTPHQLRHSFATDLIESGATVFEAQKLLRHSSVTTTETYIHNLQNKLRDTYCRIKRQGIYNKDSLYWSHSSEFSKSQVFFKEKA